jgi:hypothetical protein
VDSSLDHTVHEADYLVHPKGRERKPQGPLAPGLQGFSSKMTPMQKKHHAD